MTPNYERETPGIQILNRRKMLVLMGATAAAALAGCGRSGAYNRATVGGCVVSPEQTEGPYFVDEKLNRSDIREDPSNGSTKPGVPLRLALNVYGIANDTCKPLPGAMVDIWHCDALGAYSDVQDRPGEFPDTRGMKFLRGYQVTDAEGRVEFQTIYPGWYRGRAVHIHYKIRTDPTSRVGREFTSQLYFDEAVTDQVHSQAPYAQKGQRDTTNERDGIYRRGGADLMLQLTRNGEGYAGANKVGFLLT